MVAHLKHFIVSELLSQHVITPPQSRKQGHGRWGQDSRDGQFPAPPPSLLGTQKTAPWPGRGVWRCAKQRDQSLGNLICNSEMRVLLPGSSWGLLPPRDAHTARLQARRPVGPIPPDQKLTTHPSSSPALAVTCMKMFLHKAFEHVHALDDRLHFHIQRK